MCLRRASVLIHDKQNQLTAQKETAELNPPPPPSLKSVPNCSFGTDAAPSAVLSAAEEEEDARVWNEINIT